MSSQVFNWLLEPGVHVGSDLSRGHNQQYNQHLVGVVRRKEALLLSGAGIMGRNQGRTRRIPMINPYSVIASLRAAVSFIRKLGHLGGRILYHHPDMWDNSLYAHSFARSIRSTSHSLYHSRWLNGSLTNYYGCFFEFITYLYEYREIKSKERRITFMGIFIRMLIHTCFMVPTEKSWEMHFKENVRTWKALVFLRHFKYYYRIPSVVVTMNPEDRIGIVSEGGRVGVPVVSTVDTDGTFNCVTYPLLSNDDSFILCIFIFNVLNSAYDIGRGQRYEEKFVNLRDSQRRKRLFARLRAIDETYMFRNDENHYRFSTRLARAGGTTTLPMYIRKKTRHGLF